MDKIAGYVEVGHNGKGEVVINLPVLEQTFSGSFLTFSPAQARHLAASLERQAALAEVDL